MHRETLHNEAAIAILWQLRVEIEQLADLASRESEIGEHLGLVNWSGPIDNVGFYDHLLFHKQVSTVSLIVVEFPVDQGKRFLPFRNQSELLRLMSQASFAG